MKILFAALAMVFNLQPATLCAAYDDTAVFETADGNQWEAYVDDADLAPGEYELVFFGDAVIQFVKKWGGLCPPL